MHVIRAPNQLIWNRKNLMNNKLKRLPQSAAPTSSKKVYLGFELTPIMLSRIKGLARQARCTPFRMCVELIRKRLTARSPRARS